MINIPLSLRCKELYHQGGQSKVFDYANKLIKGGNTSIKYKYCKPCDCESPSEGGSCLVCGSTISK